MPPPGLLITQCCLYTYSDTDHQKDTYIWNKLWKTHTEIQIIKKIHISETSSEKHMYTEMQIIRKIHISETSSENSNGDNPLFLVFDWRLLRILMSKSFFNRSFFWSLNVVYWTKSITKIHISEQAPKTRMVL